MFPKMITKSGVLFSACCGLAAVLVVNFAIDTAYKFPQCITDFTIIPRNLFNRVLRSNCEWMRRPTITPETPSEGHRDVEILPDESKLVEYEYVCHPPCIDNSEKLLTETQLNLYNGNADSQGLYLALLGEIYDVEKGAQHYRPGGGYSFFAGRDATRAYITGDFSESGLVDDVEGLDEESLLGLEEWQHFYRTEYAYVGKLIGRYYDEQGCPTAQLEKVWQMWKAAHEKQEQEEAEHQTFPPCNSEWNVEKGMGRVWCSNMSGGIDRDWVGVPRKLFRPGKGEPSCVCVRDHGPPSSTEDPDAEHRDIGDLGNPNLQEYPDCEPASVSCPLRT